MRKITTMMMKRLGDAIGGHQTPEDDEWGRIRSKNGSSKAVKMEGSRAYARRTLGCDNPTDPPMIKVPFLTALAAEQVAKHISDKEILQLVPLHARLIQGTGIKRKNDKGEGEWSPTHIEQKKKKAGGIKDNILENDEDITLGDNTKTGKNETTTKKYMNKDDKN